MSHYVIGDIQGCHSELCRLLDLIGFSKKYDQLWCAGDLVNRGPASAAVLRELMALGTSANSVLGNHDLHLLVRDAGFLPPKKYDHLEDVMTAKDRHKMIEWLRMRPMAAMVEGHLLVHAGAVPQWSVKDVLRLAAEVDSVLHSDDEKVFRAFLRDLYGNKPTRWHEGLTGMDRQRAIVNVLTRLRFCAADGEMDFKETGSPANAPTGMKPWFMHEHRQSADTTLVCGHWSTLGLLLLPRVMMLDSGCLWGGMLTAVRLEDRKIYQVSGIR